jgi:acetate kinase
LDLDELMKILVLNAGSSSQKIHLYDIHEPLPDQAPDPLWKGDADWTKTRDKVDLSVENRHGKKHEEEIEAGPRPAIVGKMLQMLWSGPTQVIEHPTEIALVGHRIVHGGTQYRASTRLTSEVKAAIQQLAEFAPLHNPANLEGVKAIEGLLHNVPQVAVFDTSYHSQMPLHAITYPGPYEWFEQGIRRYGFHGISHHYCARRSAQILGRDLSTLRLVNCHLGNGCSLAAIQDGHSIDTTMGFTPLEGLMMGTRSGSVDPSILLYLQREKGYDSARLDSMLNKESGLEGISGISSDMRKIMQAIEENDNERAILALDIYVYRLRLFIGMMAAALRGIDVLTFTGGVGENSAMVRARACEGLAYLNLALDAEKNAASPVDQDIAVAESATRVLVVRTEEDWEIARECYSIVHQS